MPLLDDLVDEPDRPRLFRMYGAAREHHCHSLDRVYERGEPECATQTGMKPEKDLRKAEARTSDRNAVPASERQFEPSAQTVAVDDGDCGHRERRQPVDDVVRALNVPFYFSRVPD